MKCFHRRNLLSSIHLYFEPRFRKSKYLSLFFFFRLERNISQLRNFSHFAKKFPTFTKKPVWISKFGGERGVVAVTPLKPRPRFSPRFYSGRPAVVDIFFFAVPYRRVNPIKRQERALATHDGETERRRWTPCSISSRGERFRFRTGDTTDNKKDSGDRAAEERFPRAGLPASKQTGPGFSLL